MRGRLEDPELCDECIAGDGVDLHIVTTENGPPIVPLHGFPFPRIDLVAAADSRADGRRLFSISA